MITRSEFRPAWWLPGRHLQTLYPSLFRQRHIPPLRRERLELADGDFLDIDWTTPARGQRILVLHGLEGSIESHYAGSLLHSLAKAGYTAGLLYFRGRSGTPNRLARSYHSGETGDLEYIVRRLQKQQDNPPLSVIGFSLGGNVLLKWLGECGENAGIQQAISISVPFDLDAAARQLDCGLSRIYRNHLLRKLRLSVINKAKTHPSPWPPERLHELRSFREFDNAITAPLHGFKDVDDYYSRASCKQFLTAIRVPTLILQALDDPFLPASALPRPADLSPSVTFELADQGGHVGFIAGAVPFKPHFWLEQR
ncbi:MAG: hydrolase, partial [Gammaproteobacteria bacterium]|nr:hydrolase [Gammaproteobacteria bacterium]